MSAELLEPALAAHREGRLEDAERGYRAVLAATPEHPDALALLGVVREALGDPAGAVELIRRAIARDSATPLFRFYLGNALTAARDYDEAAAAYTAALALKPDWTEARYNLGNVLWAAERWGEAVVAWRDVLAAEPRHARARHNLSLAHEKAGDPALACRVARQVTLDAPDWAEGWINLCRLAEITGEYPASLEAAHKAVALAPQNPETWLGKGVALNRLARHAEAQDAYRAALALRPDWPEAWDNLGQTFQFLNRLGEAEAAYRACIRAAGQEVPDAEVERLDEKAFGNRHWHLALLELLKGDYRRGFARYRARFGEVGGLRRPAWPQPLWRGEPLAGRTILVQDEQGLGDALMLARYLPLLKRQGARVLLHTQPALVPYFTGWEGVDQVVARDATPTGFDVHASLFDLPHRFGTTLETVPSAGAYLPRPEPDAATQLPAVDEGEGRPVLRVGVVWAGAPRHKQDALRSVPLGAFAALFRTSRPARFYNLTRDKRPGDDALLKTLPVEDLAPRLRTLADTARFLAQMDLVVTCDTSTAHLAGGMGVPVWTLLPFAPDWRWLLEREDTPWYASMRLFRQGTPGAWEDVMARAAAALERFVLAPRAALDVKPSPPPPSSPPPSPLPPPPPPLPLPPPSPSPSPSPSPEPPPPAKESTPVLPPARTPAHEEARRAERDGAWEKILELCGPLLAATPDDSEALVLQAHALNRLQRHADALPLWERAIAGAPGNLLLRKNRALTLQKMNRLEEAHAALQDILQRAGATPWEEDVYALPEDSYLPWHWDAALLDLARGQFVRGFARTRARFKAIPWLKRLELPCPRWTGEAPRGKTLLIHDEQGLGDALMFARYVPLLKAQGARVRLVVQESLVPLFRGWTAVDQVYPRGATVPSDFDFYASLMDLPWLFGTSAATLPAKVPYLPTPAPEGATYLPPVKGPRIGLVWAGSVGDPRDPRHLPLALLEPLLALGRRERGGITPHFFGLTRDRRAGDETFMAAHGITDLAPRLGNFADTARFLAQMDLVITCDTSVAHLAGGMGRPGWVLLGFAPDWRWYPLESEMSLWYPTLRLFRQARAGDWAPVVAQARARLERALWGETGLFP